jgi:large conductance mechanosensitive channel
MTVRNGRRAATGFLRDFREFALKGNVVELAIAVIIGAAFGKIVTSLVDDVIMALINPLLKIAGVNDWTGFIVWPGIRLGSFLSTILNFVIIAFALFLAIQAIERLKRKEVQEEAAAAPDPQERLTLAIERLTEVLESQGK